MKIVVLFDLDSTLVRSFTTEVLPNVFPVLQTLKELGIPIGVCTNQAGPAWRLATKDKKYPTSESIAENLVTIAQALGLTEVPWFISVGDARLLQLEGGYDAAMQAYIDLLNLLSLARKIPYAYISTNLSWRKPEPGMLYAAMEVFKVTKATKIFYVGDMASDKEAAQRAGVTFIHATNLKDVPDLINLQGEKR